MAKAKILVVDDEKDIIELLSYNLELERFKVISATDGEKALELVSKERPDIIILDLMLPGIDGLDVCRELKRNDHTAAIPIIMLTAKGEESDIVVGLELGADDYITKPFSPRILVARVKAVLRRLESKKDESEAIKIDQLSIDLIKQVKEKDKELLPGDAVTLAMYIRWLKRINSHLRNITTSVVNPFDQIGFKPKEDF